MKKIVVLFKNKISFFEIPLFRGAILSLYNTSNNIYHNHDNINGYIYRYPLIQYKIIDNKAAIIAIGEKVDMIEGLIKCFDQPVFIGKKAVVLQLESITYEEFIPNIISENISYKITKWLPLNETNYKKYLNSNSLIDQIEILENVLIGNIISLCKGISFNIEHRIICKITEMSPTKMIKHKGVFLVSFDAKFNTNILLTDDIGLGKGSSHGFGQITKHN